MWRDWTLVPKLSHFDSAHRKTRTNPVSNMLVLERPYRSDSTYVGNIIPLSQLHGPVQLTPVFGDMVDSHLTAYNSFHFSTQYHLNTYLYSRLLFWEILVIFLSTILTNQICVYVYVNIS